MKEKNQCVFGITPKALRTALSMLDSISNYSGNLHDS